NPTPKRARPLSSLRFQTRPYLRVYLSGKESIGPWPGFRRGSRSGFFSALQNQGRHGHTESAGHNQASHQPLSSPVGGGEQKRGKQNCRNSLCVRLGTFAKRPISP